ncbi:hypothetical protein [Dubosiella newyorkensis]|uniref:hypothetical protein n=1 Tax=Dubosiella newyorkensis TaxID=1862672 RepID=UPI00272D0A2A|nr:hypothetical protein [Dubosiella newyorkensis]
MSEGWAQFYNGLLDQGKIPYRDFYFHLPPLNLLNDYIIWKLSFGYFIIYRMWRLAERILIVEIMYYLLIKKVKPSIAFVGCFMGAVFGSATVFDLGGDYNQLQQLLIALIAYTLIKYIENIKIPKKKYGWCIATGIIGGLMFLTKQPLVLASLVCFGIMMVFLWILKIDKNIFRTIFFVVLGASIPLCIAGAYLINNNAIHDFIYQVFQDTGSKGSLYEIVFGRILTTIKNNIFGILSLIFCILSYYMYINQNQIRKNYAFMFGILGGIFGSYYIWNTGDVAKRVILFFLLMTLLVSFLTLNNRYKKIAFPLVICVEFICLIINPKHLAQTIYLDTALFREVPELLTLIFIFFIIWILYDIITKRIKNENYDTHGIIIAFSGLASGYATIMSNGEVGVVPSCGFILFPAFTYLIFKNKTIQNNKYFVLSFNGILVTFFGICLSQKLVSPYSWWGDPIPSYWEKTETVNIKALKGFKFSPLEKKKYEDLNRVIGENTDKGSVIWGFPHTKVFNIFQENYNMNGFVPVEFYDVCADDFAIEEAKLLAKNKPDIVIWQDMPGALEAHEEIYRGGNPLGQRELQKWFSSVKEKDYKLIGQVDNVFVYKLKDGQPITETFIERKSAENITSNYVDPTPEVVDDIELEGLGSIKDPYLISSIEDLEYFRDSVNSGTSFNGQFLKQTANIDLSEINNWDPIGHFESGNFFEGNYNGDGFKIENLKIKKGENNAGLFGQLIGTVENVNLHNCNIKGAYVGGITSQGASTTRIINCLVTGKLEGEGRAGGIADNLGGGSIINCVADVELKGAITSGISGYYQTIVTNCFSNMADGVSIDDGEKITDDTVKKLNDFQKKLDDQELRPLLNKWKTVDGKLIISSD